MSDQSQQTISFAEFDLDKSRRVLRCAGKPVAMNAKTFDLLAFLLENNGRVVTKEEILEAVWEGHFVEEANLSVQISALRKVLGEKKDAPRFLVTVPGKGYKFIADVENDEGEIVIEKHRISRLVYEENEEQAVKTEEKASRAAGEKVLKTAKISASPSLFRYSSKTLTIAGLAAFVLLAAGFVTYRYLLPGKETGLPFARVKLTRLTNNGKISAATLSPDGKFIAYVLNEAEGSSLWVRQTGAANDTRILPPVKAEFWGLIFTPDGTGIYYNLFSGDKADCELYRIPTLGGVSQKIPNVIAHAISFAPDGQRFAYIQPDSGAKKNYLVIADADGTNQRTIAEKPQPETFVFDGDFTAWSPDGETIACLVNHLKADENYHALVGINVRDGTETVLTPQKWREIRSFEWLRDGRALLVSGGEKSGAKNQIWVVSPETGESRAVTDDFNHYSALGVGAANDSFIALENSETNRISVGDGENFREIVSEVSALNPLVLTPDGKIVFRSFADGVSNLWRVDADGTNRRQLTADAQVDDRGMCLSADGKYIVFVSWRTGRSNLWRVDADGKNLRPLTDGEADAYPTCMPDGKTIVFQRGILSQPFLWKVSIDGGGEAVRLTDFRAKWSAASTDGSRISYFKMVESLWRIGFLSADGQPSEPDISVPANLKEHKIQWSADNRELYYIGTLGNTGNIWRLGVADGQAQALTSLKNYYLTDFSFSADYQKLVIAQNVRLSDVVLITEVK